LSLLLCGVGKSPELSRADEDGRLGIFNLKANPDFGTGPDQGKAWLDFKLTAGMAVLGFHFFENFVHRFALRGG